MPEPCRSKHPTLPGVECCFGLRHTVNYHFGGADDSNGNMGYRWPVTDADKRAREIIETVLFENERDANASRCAVWSVDGATVRARLEREPTAAEMESLDALVRAAIEQMK